MRAFVFTDAALARHAGRFVWLSVDTERAGNAAFLERYPVEVWPSLLVIDPRDERVALSWAGSATVPQLVALLDDAERALKGGTQGADALLARADRLAGEGAKAQAATTYREALQRAPPEWPRRARTVESLLLSLAMSDATEECVSVARAELPKMEASPSRANAAVLGLGCALELQSSQEGRMAALQELEGQVRQAIALATSAPPAIAIAADDVSSMYETLVSARRAADDPTGAKRDAAEWARFLEREAERGATAEQRAVFDPHRLMAYLALGEPERAVTMLQQSERALPDDYNPPARLAYVYKEMGRYDDALAASERALARAYGPRRLRVLQTRAEILAAKGDPAAARATLEGALRELDALPKPQQTEGARKRLTQQLEALAASR
jgi:tetratricopeptide (TPR) repeat protein